MKDWKNLYPLNTFSGEQKKELKTFISSLLEKQKKELLEEIDKIDFFGRFDNEKPYSAQIPRDVLKEKIKSLIIKQ